jgi:hypothetical protein
MIGNCPLNCATIRDCGENISDLADSVAERGGFEPPVSREVFPKENTRECWDISRRTRLTASRE